MGIQYSYQAYDTDSLQQRFVTSEKQTFDTSLYVQETYIFTSFRGRKHLFSRLNGCNLK